MWWLGVMCIVSGVWGASFECARAQSHAEKAICANTTLSHLDEELNRAYQAALKRSNRKSALVEAQRAWILRRDALSPSHLENLMRERIAQLESTQTAPDKGVYFDPKTALLWQDNADVERNPKTYTEALRYCQDLSLANHTHWRLPTRAELVGITVAGNYAPSIKNGFKQLQQGGYWSSSLDPRTQGNGWIVDFNDGSIASQFGEYRYFVRCVH